MEYPPRWDLNYGYTALLAGSDQLRQVGGGRGNLAEKTGDGSVFTLATDPASNRIAGSLAAGSVMT